jgi:hypothetical protein
VCGRDDEPQFDGTCKDCLGDVNGDAVADSCGTCRSGSDAEQVSDKNAGLVVESSGRSSEIELISRSSTAQQATSTQKFMQIALPVSPGMDAPTMAITSG